MSTAVKPAVAPTAPAAVQADQTLKSNPAQAATSAAALPVITKTPVAGSVVTDVTFAKLEGKFTFKPAQAAQVRNFLNAVRTNQEIPAAYEALKAVVTTNQLKNITSYARGDLVPKNLVAQHNGTDKSQKTAAKALINAFFSNKQDSRLLFLAGKLAECEASTYSARAKATLAFVASKFTKSTASTATDLVPAEETSADDIADVEEDVGQFSFKEKAVVGLGLSAAGVTAFVANHHLNAVTAAQSATEAFKACEAARRFYSASCGAAPVVPTLYETASNLVAQASPYVAPVLAKGSAVTTAVLASPYTVPAAVALGTVGAATLAYKNRAAIASGVKTAYFYSTLTAGAVASKAATKAQNAYAAVSAGLTSAKNVALAAFFE